MLVWLQRQPENAAGAETTAAETAVVVLTITAVATVAAAGGDAAGVASPRTQMDSIDVRQQQIHIHLGIPGLS